MIQMTVKCRIGPGRERIGQDELPGIFSTL
jgi:hypothetical protein